MINNLSIRIGIIGGIKPERNKFGNLYEIGKILTENYNVDIISYKNGHKKDLYNLFNFKNYTKLKPSNRILYIIRQFINIKGYCKTESAKVIISLYNIGFEGIFNIFFAKKYNKKSIVRLAGNPFNSFKNFSGSFKKILSFLFFSLILLNLIKKADRIITMSEETKNKLIKTGYNENKIRVIMQPINYDLLKLNVNLYNKETIIFKNKINAIIVGKLCKYKGVDSIKYIINDKKLREKYHFIFVGKDTENYEKELRIYDNLTFLGYIPRKRLIRYLHSVDLLIHPSYSEGFPKVVIEAYACGCPIVARDIVNIDRLANYVFNTDEELLKILIKNNFKRTEEVVFPDDFKYDIIKKQYNDLIEELI